MTLERPDYWLVYLSDGDDRAGEITATAPCVVDRPRFSRDTQLFLAAVDAYHATHPGERVVFAAEVTRWLDRDHGRSWADLEVDFYEALAELDVYAPELLIQASPIARAVVANAADHLTIYMPDRIEDAAAHTEPCRAAILDALERDWPAYIRSVAGR